MNLETSFNHGDHREHGEKIRDCIVFGMQPSGETIKDFRPHFSVFSVPSVVIEQRLLT
jgi:hypothetical protein